MDRIPPAWKMRRTTTRDEQVCRGGSTEVVKPFGKLKANEGTHAVTKESEWGHKMRRQLLTQSFHEEFHSRMARLRNARLASWKLNRVNDDIAAQALAP